MFRVKKEREFISIVFCQLEAKLQLKLLLLREVCVLMSLRLAKQRNQTTKVPQEQEQ